MARGVRNGPAPEGRRLRDAYKRAARRSPASPASREREGEQAALRLRWQTLRAQAALRGREDSHGSRAPEGRALLMAAELPGGHGVFAASAVARQPALYLAEGASSGMTGIGCGSPPGTSDQGLRVKTAP